MSTMSTSAQAVGLGPDAAPLAAAVATTAPAVPLSSVVPAARTGRAARVLPVGVDLVVAVGVAVAVLATTATPADLRWVAAPLGWVVLLAATGLYRPRPVWAHGDGPARVARAAGVAAVAGWVLTGTTVLSAVTLPLLLVAAGTTAATLVRVVVSDALSTRRSQRTRPPVRVVLAGAPAEVRRAAEELRRAPGPRLEVVGVCSPSDTDDDLLDLPVTAGIEHLADVAERTGADVVLALPSSSVDPSVLRRVAWRLEATGTELLVGTGLVDVAVSRARLAQAGGLRMVHVRPAPSQGLARALTTAAERAGAALLLLLLAPLLGVLVAAVRLTSPGPAVFRQQRVGRHGTPFTMLKLRTMTSDAERVRGDLEGRNECDALFKIRQDPRVTPLGRVLRRYSLDELPQLVNVLNGTMSLVGPRPALPSEVARYDADPRRRLAVRPGITGLWQVSGRSDLSWAETVRLDLSYVDNWSPGLDLRILLRTVSAVLGHRGAY